MKKIIALLLTAVIMLSLVACGTKEDKPESSDADTSKTVQESTDNTEEEETTEVADVDTMVLKYNTESDEPSYVEFYCPEGAHFSSDMTISQYLSSGSVPSCQVSDNERSYGTYINSYSGNYMGEDNYLYYSAFKEIYFEGDLSKERNDEYYHYSEYEQNVTDLGFQWLGKDVKYIETKYTNQYGQKKSEVFVGVEYDIHKTVKNANGETEEKTGIGLVGCSTDPWDVELTANQYIWIAKQMFGIDSDAEWPTAE